MLIDENNILWGAGNNSDLGIDSDESYSILFTQITANYSSVTLNTNGGNITRDNVTEYAEGLAQHYQLSMILKKQDIRLKDGILIIVFREIE